MKRFYIYVCILLSSMTFLYSQTVCPPVVSTDNWTTPTYFEYNLAHIGKIGKVSFRKTTNTNPIKIAIDWTTLTDKILV